MDNIHTIVTVIKKKNMNTVLFIYGIFSVIGLMVLYNGIRNAKEVDPKEPFLYDDCENNCMN